MYRMIYYNAGIDWHTLKVQVQIGTSENSWGRDWPLSQQTCLYMLVFFYKDILASVVHLLYTVIVNGIYICVQRIKPDSCKPCDY